MFPPKTIFLDVFHFHWLAQKDRGNPLKRVKEGGFGWRHLCMQFSSFDKLNRKES